MSEKSLPPDFIEQLNDLPDTEYKAGYPTNAPYIPYEVNLLKMRDESKQYEKRISERGYHWLLFDGKSYVNIALGQRNTGGYSLILKSVKKKGNTVYIIVEEKTPFPGQVVTTALTFPFVAIILDEIPKKIEVIDTNGLTFRLHTKERVSQWKIKRKLSHLDFNDGLLCVSDYGKFGYINKKGRIIIDFKYDDAKEFRDGLAVIRMDVKYGVIDKEGNIVIECKYDELGGFDEGLANAKFEGKYGLIDKSGRTVIDFLYDQRVYFDKNDSLDGEYAEVKINGKYGMIDKTGKLVIACEYDAPFEVRRNRLIVAKKNMKYGLLDLNGNIIADFVYNHIDSFNNHGMAIVNVNNMFGMVNEKGEVVLEPIYDWMEGIGTESWRGYWHIFRFSTGCSGVADPYGNIVIPVEYSNNMIFYENGTARVERHNPPGYFKEYIFDNKGNIVE